MEHVKSVLLYLKEQSQSSERVQEEGKGSMMPEDRKFSSTGSMSNLEGRFSKTFVTKENI